VISTSYAPTARVIQQQPTLFETESPQYDETLSEVNGKIFIVSRDANGDKRIDVNDLEWEYLKGDGDFRSDEVKALRDEADIIITNPPFSLFRDFLAWILEANKDLVIIGNMSAISNKEVFPLIQENKIWLGNGFLHGNAFFSSPNTREYSSGVFDESTGLVKFRNVVWFSTLDHGRRHQPLTLMTEAENFRFSKDKKVKGVGYQKYDNYDAIEVPSTAAIPSDYYGVMGVPISFLDKYNPEQFEILGSTQRGCHDKVPDLKKYDLYREMKADGTPTGSSGGKTNENPNLERNDGKNNYFINDEGHVVQSAYSRIFIKHRKAPK
jgi:hypothetical protein